MAELCVNNACVVQQSRAWRQTCWLSMLVVRIGDFLSVRRGEAVEGRLCIGFPFQCWVAQIQDSTGTKDATLLYARSRFSLCVVGPAGL